MPSQQAIVRDDDVVPDRAIVADMRPRHQEIVISEFCDATVGAATMNRTIFANDVVVSDFDLRSSFWRERKILRRHANNRAISDKIARSDRDISLDDNVRLHDRLITYHRVRADHRERTDLDVGAELRIGSDKCRRMNFSAAHGLIGTQTCSLCDHQSFTPATLSHRTRCLCSKFRTMVLFTARLLP